MTRLEPRKSPSPRLTTSPLLILSSYLSAQNVYIPDANFKSYLINNSFINLNSDDEIQIEEANNYEGHIDCSNKSISNLEGINAFKKIYYLNCSSNELTSLNVSSNTKLIILIATLIRLKH